MKETKNGKIIIKFSLMWFFVAIIIIALVISFFKNRIFATNTANKETETVVAFEENQKSVDVVQVMLENTNSDKKMINEQKTIAILKTSGYLKKNIITIYVMQTLILNLIIYLLSIILFNISFYIIINRIPLLIGIDLLMGKIKLRCLPYIISFVIVVIIPSIITLFGIKKMYKYDISKLSKGDK